MRFGKSVLAVAFVIGLSRAAFNANAGSGGHWGYEGEHGPEHWGHMSGEYKACAEGKTQSPIDLSNAAAEELADIKFEYKPSKLNIVNNGHTVQVNYDNGSSISVTGPQQDLGPVHFHNPPGQHVAGQ